MLARIIFFAAVTAATLAVILLPLLTPVPAESEQRKLGPWKPLSLYLFHTPAGRGPGQPARPLWAGVFVFHHELREGPARGARVVGTARGFAVPVEPSTSTELAAFDIVHLALEAPAYKGGLSVEARRGHGREEAEELVVVGGTGAFAFARGYAEFSTVREGVYRLDLRLRFPTDSPTIPG